MVVPSSQKYRKVAPGDAPSVPVVSFMDRLKRCYSVSGPCQSVTKRRRESDHAVAPASKRMRKAVSFSESMNRRVVVHTTEEEKRNAWYNRNEYREFREDMQATALSVHLGIANFIEPEDFCLRGLEANLSPKMAIMRKLKRQLLVESILREQRLQKVVGAVNHEAIRQLSTLLSSDAQIDAVLRGVSDSQV
jgi:hypothetical protein